VKAYRRSEDQVQQRARRALRIALQLLESGASPPDEPAASGQGSPARRER
jgi:hypothetical protein